MATATRLVTVEEFLAMPEPVSGARPELHYGEIAPMTFPKLKHGSMSRRLLFLLNARLEQFGYVDKELAFRALPEYDFRAADVAFVSNSRYENSDPYQHLIGAPELVVEVLSPSNTAAEILEREQLCLENGSLEFWVVNMEKQTIHVASRTFASKLYRRGDRISLAAFGGGELSVDEVFE